MKLLIVLLLATLALNFAQAGEVKTKALNGYWDDFTIASFSLVKIDNVEMLELLLSGNELDNLYSEDANTEHLHFFFPTEVLSHDDYQIMNKNRGRISFNPFNGKFEKTKRVAKRIFSIKTSRVSEGESRGWHLCTIENDPACEDGVYYSHGPKKSTLVEVLLK